MTFSTSSSIGGSRTIQIPLDEAWPSIDRNTLFRLHWGLRKIDETERRRLIAEEFEPLLHELQAEAIREGWLRGLAAYGYFPAVADGDDLVVLDPADPKHEDEVARFTFPRQPSAEKLCLADYFQPVGGRPDLAFGEDGLAVVPVVFQHGVGDQLAVELNGHFVADHLDVKRVPFADRLVGLHLGKAVILLVVPERARSFVAAVLELLGANRIGLSLTTGDQLTPEHSTVALVVHHPEASYFAVHNPARDGLVNETAAAS